MAFGTAKTLDNALRIANTNLAEWLQTEYDLSLRALTAIIGSALIIEMCGVPSRRSLHEFHGRC